MSDKKILIVEDERIEALDIQRALESFGYEVPYIAFSGEEAIEKASELMPDLILMDISLAGDTNGIEATLTIKNLEIPVIYLTAHSDIATFQLAKLSDPYGYIVKPFDNRELQYTIELAIYKNQIEKELKTVKGKLTDLTERKLDKQSQTVKNELQNDDEIFQRAQKVAKIGIWENNLATNDLEWSQEMYEILGFPSNQPINLNEVTTIFPPEELKRFKNAIDAAINYDKPYSIDYKIIRKDGFIRYIHDEGEIIRNSAGEAIKMFGTTQDITKRKLTEKSLKESETKYRTFVETTPDMIWEINSEGIFTYISPQSTTILGYKPEQIIGKEIYSLLEPKSIPKAEESLFKHLGNDKDFVTLEVTAKHFNGKEIIIEIRSKKLTDSKGYIIGFRGIARDITEKTKANNQLLASIQEKDVLLQEIHHRVKNNMQIISSLLNLQIKHIQDENAVEILKESQNRVRSMAMIHEKLYQSDDLSKINLTDYIESLVTSLFYSYSVMDKIKPIIDVKNVELNIETAVPCGLIINELVSNSLKHAFPNSKDGEINISLKPSDDGYELTVKDNGISFPSDIDFRNTDSLGLQLVNNLVNQIEGTIEIDRSHGTEFKIIFKEVEYKKRA
jgi:PAS domain S-box-containing protein